VTKPQIVIRRPRSATGGTFPKLWPRPARRLVRCCCPAIRRPWRGDPVCVALWSSHQARSRWLGRRIAHGTKLAGRRIPGCLRRCQGRQGQIDRRPGPHERDCGVWFEGRSLNRSFVHEVQMPRGRLHTKYNFVLARPRWPGRSWRNRAARYFGTALLKLTANLRQEYAAAPAPGEPHRPAVTLDRGKVSA